jgi:pimeloyl-ACP methyl ester carboxylesterase
MNLLGASILSPTGVKGLNLMIVFADVRNHGFIYRIFNQVMSEDIIKKRQPWLQDYSYARGLAKFLTLKTFMQAVIAPLIYASSVLIPSGNMVDDHQLLIKSNQPIIIFSHGIAGSRFMYSQFAHEACKRGYMVIAIEHMDGSAISFQDEKGQIMHYQHPPGDEEAAKVFRRTQLIKRSKELESLLKHVNETWPNRDIYLAGHSFGGTTAFYSSTLEKVQKLGVKKVLLVDPWWYALEESDLNNGTSSKYYCATTEKFHWPEQDQMAERIVNSGNLSI